MRSKWVSWCRARSRAAALGAAVFLLPISSAAAPADLWDALHAEIGEKLAALADNHFRPGATASASGSETAGTASTVGHPWLIVVGFTGGLETKNSRASGVAALSRQLGARLASDEGVQILTYNSLRWRRAATDVLRIVRTFAAQPWFPERLPQPLVVATGHSWGAASIAKLARELGKEGVEISLAVFIDAVGWRNPRLPPNVRLAVNLYQRSGALSGLLLRGKSKLIARDPERTRILGSYRIDPKAARWGWSWNLLQPLLFRQHHRIAHDVRLPAYLLEAVRVKREALKRLHPVPAPAPLLFDRVVILGASVSAGEKAPSPGWMLARHLGAPAEAVSVFAEGGAESDKHLRWLDEIARLRPTLIVALDLFYHDFKLSLFLSDSKKEYLRSYLGRLHETGAALVVGNIPSLVLLRHEHVNRYLETLTPEFPNLILLDLRSLDRALEREGVPVRIAGRDLLLRHDDVFADREHPNALGSALLANRILAELIERFPERLPADASPIDLSAYFTR